MNEGIRVHLVDTQFVRPEFTAVYLLECNGRLLFFDTGVGPSVPVLLNAVAQINRTPEDVDAIVVSHVHLDHGGGAGLLASACPNATVYAHPRAARHFIDPSKLTESARLVYGNEEFERLFNPILPISADRVTEAPDGFELQWQGRVFQFFDAPGHAKHHLIMVDPQDRRVFAGDAFGLRYPGARSGLPTTSPTQFDPEAMIATFQKIVDLHPRTVYLAHFGAISDAQSHASELTPLVREFAHLATETRTPEQLVSILGSRVAEDDRALYGFDLQMDAQGLAHWANQLPAASRE
jgi:glyoxylase-like metal-dependent hydrolase (beta-lactamase superfamily II)